MSACVSVRALRALLMAGLIAATSLSVSRTANAQASTANQWTWMGGSDTTPQLTVRGLAGVYGTLGTPAAGNIPGSRAGATAWTDSAGNFWLFGGGGYDSTGQQQFYLNDLWEFNPSTNEWAWMGGSSTGGQAGVYGTLGTPAAGSVPGSRSGASGWTDLKGNLWLFGGDGIDGNGQQGSLNDLWEFDPSANEWTWIAGSSTTDSGAGLPGVYGTLGTPAAGNDPGSRGGATTWVDSGGNLWLFGGLGYDSHPLPLLVNGWLNDLWEFNPATSQWTWMGGSSTIPCNTPEGCVQAGTYGTLGSPSAANIPGGRHSASSWVDGSGRFWLFGGSGVDSNYNWGELNDLWEYNPSTKEWTWVSGSSTVPGWNEGGQPGVYGTLGTPAVGNVPGGRDSAASWTDKGGNLWLFGGNGSDATGNDSFLNDLWEFNPLTNQWTWMGGNSVFNASSPAQFGVYGTLGTPAPGNIPGSRSPAASWTDISGNFWLFGGEGPLPDNGTWFLFYLDDFWRYQPSTTPSFTNTPTPTFSVAAGNYTSIQTISISDEVPGATIYYTTDGSTPTVSSTTYTSPITVSLFSTTETINAIAVASGYFSSEVASATYVIDLPPSSGTITLLTSSPNPSSVREYVTFTATVRPVSNSAMPAGTVQFSADGGSPLSPPVPLNSSGVATYSTAALFAGGANVMATYTPSSGSPFTASMSAPVFQSVGGPCPGVSSTALSSSQNPSSAGQPVIFTATVAAGAFPQCIVGGGGAPGGTSAPTGIFGAVQFYVNGTAAGSPVALVVEGEGFASSGVASYTASPLPSGTDLITAVFLEGNGYVEDSASAPLSQVVNGSTGSGGFTLTPSAPALTIAQGGSGSDVITVTDLGGFNGSVGLSVSGLPTGVTAGFSPGPSTGTSELSLTASGTAVTGTSTITVVGTADGLTESTTIALTVSAPARFGLVPSAAALSITQGASGTDTITISVANGFAFGVSLGVSGLPTGVTGSFSQNPATATSVLTLAASSAAVPGVYTATVAGTIVSPANVISPADMAQTSVQFAVVSAGAGSPPAFGSTTASVTAGSMASYAVTVPSGVTSVYATCLNLPAGAACSYSSSTNLLTIATASTTPAGTYQVMVVFTETVSSTAASGTLMPILLLPLLILRRKMNARGIWSAACLLLILMAATVCNTGCSGGTGHSTVIQTHQVTTTGVVSLTVR